jgi:hypothetical protein
MPGVLPTFDRGPLTFSANVNISGGQLVTPDGTTGRIKPTTASTDRVLGVALGDAAGVAGLPGDTTDFWGNSIANMNPFPPNETAVANTGIFKLLNGSGATIAFGALVMAAANGGITAFTGTDATQVVGRCVEPGGISNGARGKIRLGLV